jgi:hypothetical protein
MKLIRLYFVVVALCISTLNAGWIYQELEYFPGKTANSIIINNNRAIINSLLAENLTAGTLTLLLRVVVFPYQGIPRERDSLDRLRQVLNHKNLPLLDVILRTIDESLENNEQLLVLKRLLMICDADQLILFFLSRMEGENLMTLLKKNSVIRNWFSMSAGKDWQFINDLRDVSAAEFSKKIVHWLEKKEKSIRVNTLKKSFDSNEEQSINRSREAFFQTIQCEGDLKAFLSLTTDDLEYLKSREGDTFDRPDFSLSELLGSEKESLTAKLDRIFQQLESEDGDKLPAKGPNDEQHPAIHNQSSLFEDYFQLTCSIVAASSLVPLYILFYLKRTGSMLRKKSCWIHWNHLSLSELEESPPERVIDLIIPDILMRSHSKKVFCTNEKILNDFLREIEYERTMLNFYGTWGKRMGRLGRLVGVDYALVQSAPTRLKKLELLHQKVWSYIIATKSIKIPVA